MRRVSNLAFNREFPAATGLTGLPSDNTVFLRRDLDNPYDPEAVGVWLDTHPDVPVGWLYRKDSNRPDVLKALQAGKILRGRVRVRTVGSPGQKVVVFWL
jgi:hypothetical protein